MFVFQMSFFQGLFVLCCFITLCLCLQVFSQMVFVGVSFSFSCLVQVLAACVQEIQLNLSKIASPGSKDDPVQLQVSSVRSGSACFVPDTPDVLLRLLRPRCHVFNAPSHFSDVNF